VMKAKRELGIARGSASSRASREVARSHDRCPGIPRFPPRNAPCRVGIAIRVVAFLGARAPAWRGRRCAFRIASSGGRCSLSRRCDWLHRTMAPISKSSGRFGTPDREAISPPRRWGSTSGNKRRGYEFAGFIEPRQSQKFGPLIVVRSWPRA
jgi:hypothetical protein